MRERYERALRWRAANESERTRDEFWIKIDAVINEAKSLKFYEKRDNENI